ncbi:MAG TPA: TolC family protein, partial [Longimicrobiales bacterium]
MTRVLLLAAFAWPAALAAQQAPPDPLLPADAVAYARDHSPAYRQLLNDMDVARARTRAAWGSFLPSLSLSAGTGAGTSTVVTGEDDAGQPIRLAEPLEFTSSSSSQSVGLNMTLFDGASFQELAAQRADADATRARIEEGALSLDARVLTLYWQAVQRAR